MYSSRFFQEKPFRNKNICRRQFISYHLSYGIRYEVIDLKNKDYHSDMVITLSYCRRMGKSTKQKETKKPMKTVVDERFQITDV